MANTAAGLDEETRRAIANTTGGRYFRAKDPSTLVGIYELIDTLEPVEQETAIFRPTPTLYPWPLAASLLAWVLILLGDWIGRSRLRLGTKHA